MGSIQEEIQENVNQLGRQPFVEAGGDRKRFQAAYDQVSLSAIERARTYFPTWSDLFAVEVFGTLGAETDEEMRTYAIRLAALATVCAMEAEKRMMMAKT